MEFEIWNLDNMKSGQLATFLSKTIWNLILRKFLFECFWILNGWILDFYCMTIWKPDLLRYPKS